MYIFKSLPSLLVSVLIQYRGTRISQASLTKSNWWLTISQPSGRKENNLQREEDDVDSSSYLKKIEYPVHKKDWTLSIHQPGVWKHRLPQEEREDKRTGKQLDMA